MTILVLFHQSQMKTFKDFYLRIAQVYYRSYFPKLLRYNRFVEWTPRTVIPFMGFFLFTRGECTRISFIDSMPIKVCRPIRTQRNKVFRGLAQSGKSSMGWFFGFKLHTIINHKGEIIDVRFSSGNVHDTKMLPPDIQNTFEKSMLSKRVLIETVFGKLKSWTTIGHSRHPSPRNLLVNLFSVLVSHNKWSKKPKIPTVKPIAF